VHYLFRLVLSADLDAGAAGLGEAAGALCCEEFFLFALGAAETVLAIV